MKIHAARSTRCSRASRGFTLIELLVVIGVISTLISILLPALGRARRAGRATVCSSNMRQTGIGYNTYAADFKDYIASFTWQGGGSYSDEPNWNPPPQANQFVAASYQAADIVRRQGNRSSGVFPPTNWTPHYYFTHLVLIDYLGNSLPDPIMACPEDSVRQSWQRLQRANSDSNVAGDWKLPYSSTYSFVPASYSQDARKNGRDTVSSAGTQASFNNGSLPLGGRKYTEVAFPGSKVAMFDEVARHNGKPVYHCYEDAVAPLLFWDGSVRTLATRLASLGSNPNGPVNSTSPYMITYEPQSIINDPAPRSGTAQPLAARYQWTRGGLAGVDFGGSTLPE